MKMKTLLSMTIKPVLLFVAVLTVSGDFDIACAQAPVGEAASAPIRLGAPSKPASAPAAKVAPAPAAAPSGTALKAETPKKELTTADFYGLNFALDNVDQILVSRDLGLTPNFEFWVRPDPKAPVEEGLQKFTSHDSKQAVEFSFRSNGKYDLIATNKTRYRATITQFNRDNKPESYTVVGPYGEYTATPRFCEILKFQTNSSNYKELADKAVTCRDFYSRPGVTDSTESLQQTLDTHRENVRLLKESSAASLVPKSNETFNKKLVKFWTDNDDFRDKDFRTPRALLTRNSSAQDLADRHQIADIAEACSRLWNESESRGGTAAKPAVRDASAK